MVKTNSKAKIIAVVVACVSGILYWGFFVPVGGHPEKLYQGEVRTLIKDLVLQEESYFADSGTYTSDIDAIGLVVPESVNLQIEELHTISGYRGFRANAESKEVNYTCRAIMSPLQEPLAISPDSLVEPLPDGYECESGEGS